MIWYKINCKNSGLKNCYDFDYLGQLNAVVFTVLLIYLFITKQQTPRLLKNCVLRFHNYWFSPVLLLFIPTEDLQMM